MKISEQQLRRIVAGESIGEVSPWREGDLDVIDDALRSLSSEIAEAAGLVVAGEFDAYGSGFASYVHLFCHRGSESAIELDQVEDPAGPKAGDAPKRLTTIRGLAIYLCRLAPVAVWGPETRTRSSGSESWEFLDAEQAGQLPDPSWQSTVQTIQRICGERGVTVLESAELRRPAPSGLTWNTNFGQETVFDALFYWSD